MKTDSEHTCLNVHVKAGTCVTLEIFENFFHGNAIFHGKVKVTEKILFYRFLNWKYNIVLK